VELPSNGDGVAEHSHTPADAITLKPRQRDGSSIQLRNALGAPRPSTPRNEIQRTSHQQRFRSRHSPNRPLAEPDTPEQVTNTPPVEQL
jgi:hypothetical protein